ncbi:MAG TPA: hypothetical protein VFU63_09980 [Ktedonobacterales bacterium]|nr:hypothetical protein [Ktedonobacterales bacterium]
MTSTTDRSALDMTGITAVEVATFGGELHVVAGADNPRVEVTIHGNATWSVERVGSLLYIVGKKRGFFYMGNGVGFRLWLPAQLALKLANVSADIRVRGDVRSLGASVTNGDIEVRASNPAEAKLRVVQGHMVIHGVTGKLDIVVAPGDVQLVNSGGELRIVAAPGDVRLEQVILTPGRSHMVTASPGTIEVMSIHAPGGLVLDGKTTHPPAAVDMPGSDIRNKGYRLHIQQPGPNPAKMTLHAIGRLSIKG